MDFMFPLVLRNFGVKLELNSVNVLLSSKWFLIYTKSCKAETVKSAIQLS